MYKPLPWSRFTIPVDKRCPIWRAITDYPEPVDPDLRLRIHEAAHAVLCIAFGGDLLHVKIGRDDRVDGAGHAAMNRGKMSFEQDALVYLAGRAAEAHLFWRDLSFESELECMEYISVRYEPDTIHAVSLTSEYLGRVPTDEEVTALYVKALESIALVIEGTKRVADALSLKPEMSADEVRAVLG